jgi:hypothetical protein
LIQSPIKEKQYEASTLLLADGLLNTGIDLPPIAVEQTTGVETEIFILGWIGKLPDI